MSLTCTTRATKPCRRCGNACAFGVTIALSTVPFLERLGGTGGTSSGEEDRAQVDGQAYDGSQDNRRTQDRGQEVDSTQDHCAEDNRAQVDSEEGGTTQGCQEVDST